MKRGLASWNRNELPEAVFASRVRSIREYMRANQLDVVLIYGDANQSGALSYVPNFFPYADTGIFMLPLSAKPRVFTTHAYRNLPWIESITWVDEIICTDHMEDECSAAMEELGCIGGRIGMVNTRAFPYPVYKRIEERLKCEITDITTDVDAMRAVKDKYEIALIEKASEIALSCMERIMPMLRPGITGFDIAAEVELTGRSQGAQDIYCVINPDNSPAGMDLPSKQTVHEVCSIELCVEYKCYWARLGRTFGLPGASSELMDGIARFHNKYLETSDELMSFDQCLEWNRRLSDAMNGPDPLQEVRTYIDPGLEPYWETHLNDRLGGILKHDGVCYMQGTVITKDSNFFSASDTFVIGGGKARRLSERI